jgi:hypothetical protein
MTRIYKVKINETKGVLIVFEDNRVALSMMSANAYMVNMMTLSGCNLYLSKTLTTRLIIQKTGGNAVSKQLLELERLNKGNSVVTTFISHKRILKNLPKFINKYSISRNVKIGIFKP